MGVTNHWVSENCPTSSGCQKHKPYSRKYEYGLGYIYTHVLVYIKMHNTPTIIIEQAVTLTFSYNAYISKRKNDLFFCRFREINRTNIIIFFFFFLISSESSSSWTYRSAFFDFYLSWP